MCTKIRAIPTLIRIERMERVLDAVKRCDSSEGGFSSRSLRTVLFPSVSVFFCVVVFLGHRSYTHARRLLSGSPCCFYFGGGSTKYLDFGIKLL